MVTPDQLEHFTVISKALDRCCELALKHPLPNKQIALMTDASFSAADYAVLIEDYSMEEYTSTRKAFAPVAYGSKTFSPAQLKMSIHAKAFLAIFFAFKEFGPKTGDNSDRQQVGHSLFQTKIIPPTLWNACDYVFQFNFTIAHIPGKTTLQLITYRVSKSVPRKISYSAYEKISPRRPLNLTSNRLESLKRNRYSTQTRMRKQKSKHGSARSNSTNQPPDILLEHLSTHNNTHFHMPILENLAKSTTMAVEQQNDLILHQLRLKLHKEEYSKTTLQQDPRYRHYCRQLDRLSVYDDIIFRDYYDETGSVHFRQALIPKHLVQ